MKATQQTTKQKKLDELYALLDMKTIDRVISVGDATLRALAAKKREC